MSDKKKTAVVSGGFDDMRCGDVRFIEEAAKSGRLHVLLWDDCLLKSVTGEDPKFPLVERLYYLEAIRFVEQVHIIVGQQNIQMLPAIEGLEPDAWVLREGEETEARKAWCRGNGVECRVVAQSELAGFPDDSALMPNGMSERRKVLVTGCFDWFHTGHIRFFEEVSELGDLYVVLGHDANIRHLKGEKHPMFNQNERRYIVQSIRYVHRALISTGHGWLDAEPELNRIKPDMYAVNEDGDKPIKRQFCEEHGIEYVVLRRTPKEGLPTRTSTDLRGH
jgi:cytidyltransferase-like protein